MTFLLNPLSLVASNNETGLLLCVSTDHRSWFFVCDAANIIGNNLRSTMVTFSFLPAWQISITPNLCFCQALEKVNLTIHHTSLQKFCKAGFSFFLAGNIPLLVTATALYPFHRFHQSLFFLASLLFYEIPTFCYFSPTFSLMIKG